MLGIYNPKSYVEIRVFSSPVRSTRRAIIFIIPNKFNVQFIPHQDIRYSVQVSFIPGCHKVNRYSQTIPGSHFVDSFVTVGQNSLAKIPVFIVWVLWQRKPIM